MSIVQHTSSNLVIKFSPIFGWILGVGGISLGICVVLLTWLSLISSEQSISGILFSLLLFIIALPLSLTPTVIATFDKSNGYFILERKWLWKNETVRHPIHTIKDVLAIRKGDFGKNRTYFKIIVELDSGELLPLSKANYRLEAWIREQARVIRVFLELEDE